ncbi:VPS52 [Auxenochlorella protothecoides x Auxenochlorella symbiontica]
MVQTAVQAGVDPMNEPSSIPAGYGAENGEDLSLGLGELDLTTEHLSLAGIEKDVEALADHEVLKAILDQGLDPREYGRRYEDELRQAELASIEDYIAEADTLIALHTDIKECDDILQGVEATLAHFQTDLGSISSEIRALQAESQSMNAKLRDRRALKESLEDFVGRVSLTPDLIHGIVQSDVQSEEFLSALQTLGRKLASAARDPDLQGTVALRDVAPELEKLRIKAVVKSRDFLFAKIWDFRRPRTNVQIKQPVLLRHKSLVAFLGEHAPDIFGEVRAAYIDKVSAKVLDLFRNYWAVIDRLEEKVLTEADTLGAAEASSSGGVLSFFQRPAPAPAAAASAGGRADAFSLQDRALVLSHVEGPPLVLHAAEARGARFPYEVLFRSVNKLLMDTAAHEYLFCAEFWGDAGVYAALFAPVLAFVESSLAAALAELHDPIALLLMVRLNRECGLAMARRGNPALDGFYDRINLLLWPRLKVLMDAQLASVKAMPVDPGSTAVPIPAVHLLAERYAALTSALLLLQADLPEEPLESNTERLRYAVMNALLSLSRLLPSKRAGTVFLILNFGHIVGVLRGTAARGLPRTGSLSQQAMSQAASGGGQGGAGANPALHRTSSSHGAVDASQGLGASGAALLKEIEEGLHRCTSIYVDDMLGGALPELIAFVRRGEALASGLPEGQALPGCGPPEAAPLAQAFAGSWKQKAEAMCREVTQDFGSTHAARGVLQAVFTQLLMQYSRFLELMKKQGPAGLGVVRDAVTLPSVMYGLNALSR